MLSDEVKKTIQDAYRQILSQRSLTPRYGQRLMIAEIARSLSQLAVDERPPGDETTNDPQSSDTEPPVCVVEAGTGTGKTLAYLLGTLPLAQHLGKKVVLATATVALQEQVIHKDLPDILSHSELDFTFMLAKGRGRYLCLSRLALLLQGNSSQSAMEELFGEVFEQPHTGNQNLYAEMMRRINAGEWHGDRDDWEGAIDTADWSPVTVEPGQCAGQKCSNYDQCFFYRAREQVMKVDCVVANHDLVLVDLALGGGAILPSPEDTIYIFDEAHHLPGKANQHFSCATRLRGSLQWLDPCSKSLNKLAADAALGSNNRAARVQGQLAGVFRALTEKLGASIPLFEQIAQELEPGSRPESQQHTFRLGVVPEEIRSLAAELNVLFGSLGNELKEISSELKRDIEQGEGLQARQQAEHWFPLIGGMAARVEASQKLWYHFSQADPAGHAPWARWITVVEQGGSVDLVLSCSPVLAASTLQEKLWQTCSAAVLTSATLSALGNFDVLAMRAGLPARASYHRIASPFDYAANARFVVPRIGVDPGNAAAHTEAIVRLLPLLLDRMEASLMLFSSRRQMLDVLDGLDDEWKELILCQDDYQKSQLLRLHRERIDNSQPSIIFGLASFAEGVDLPGKYCEHVLIAKLPFAVPNDPIEATLSQWLEAQGRNPFMTLAVPEAAVRLVQASGRLLRSEQDRGRITLFDERIVNKFYGRAIFDSLPPYTRDIYPELPAPPDNQIVTREPA